MHSSGPLHMGRGRTGAASSINVYGRLCMTRAECLGPCVFRDKGPQYRFFSILDPNPLTHRALNVGTTLFSVQPQSAAACHRHLQAACNGTGAVPGLSCVQGAIISVICICFMALY